MIYQWTKNWIKEQDYEHSAEEEMTSTNEIAKSEAFKITELPKLYLCDQQVKGRGRGANTWENSKSGEALLISWSFFSPQPPEIFTSQLVGLALYKSLVEIWPDLNWSIKPPNDLYLNDKKVAGLLIENITQGPMNRIVVGLGINFLGHPSDIDYASHIAKEVKTLDEKIYSNFLSEFKNQLNFALDKSLLFELNDHDRKDLKVAINKNNEFEVDEVLPRGDLKLKDNQYLKWMDL